jgi:RNA polymerase-binding protein DksA
MAGVRGRIGAALRRAGDVSAGAASKVTPRRATGSTGTAPAAAGTAGPAKVSAAKASPTKTSPTKTSPTKTSPTKASPAKSTPTATKAAAKTTAATKTPAKKAPAKTTVATKAPVKTTVATKAPVKKAPASSTPTAKKAAATAPPTPKAPAKKAPAKKTPAKTSAAPAAGTAPSQGGSDLSAADLAQIRTRLRDELAEMQLEYDRSMSQLEQLRQSQDGAGDDQADAGSMAFERDQEQSIAANRHLLISQIEHAIERIDSGTYGICEDCGRPIPAARLKALPMATLDAGCKARAERH